MTTPAYGPDGDIWPSLTVVMPVRDEAHHLDAAVRAVLAQDYPRPFDVVLAVAPSRDGTGRIAADLANDPRVSVVANPGAIAPTGLNAAIRASTGQVIARVDGHATLSDGYLRRAVETMRRTGAVNVGGVQRAVGSTPFERSVAVAMTSRFGTGGAPFHVGGAAGPTDTVYLGVFDRKAIEAVGLFDERLVRNQDYELNIRLRRAGGTIWFDPELEVTYQPRSSCSSLARQYFQYGWWKRVVVGMHPASWRARQMVPPLVTAVVAGGTLVGLRRPVALAAPLTYIAGVTVAAAATSKGRARRFRLAVVLATMHLSWGAGFLLGRPSQLAR